MSSSAASSSLPRILVGSLIGAVIGLILLALGVAVLRAAADAERPAPEIQAAGLTAAPDTRARPGEGAASPMPYPVLTPAPAATPPAPAEPSRPAEPWIWRSIFDDADDRPQEAAVAPPVASSPASSRPAPRPAAPRRPPEAQRQIDSLFF